MVHAHYNESYPLVNNYCYICYRDALLLNTFHGQASTLWCSLIWLERNDGAYGPCREYACIVDVKLLLITRDAGYHYDHVDTCWTSYLQLNASSYNCLSQGLLEVSTVKDSKYDLKLGEKVVWSCQVEHYYTLIQPPKSDNVIPPCLLKWIHSKIY